MLGVYIVDRPNVNLGWQFVIDSCLQFLSILQQIIQLPMIRTYDGGGTQEQAQTAAVRICKAEWHSGIEGPRRFLP